MASRAGLADSKAAKRDLKEYGFLAWLEEHLQLHERKTNLWCIRLDDFEAGSTDHSDSDNTKSLNIEHDDLYCARKKMETTQICTKVSDVKQIHTETTLKNWSCSTSWIVCFIKYPWSWSSDVWQFFQAPRVLINYTSPFPRLDDSTRTFAINKPCGTVTGIFCLLKIIVQWNYG